MTRSSLLQSWTELSSAFQELTEDECAALLDSELKGKRRIQIVLRLHGRLNKLRIQRERGELMTLLGEVR